MTTIAVDAAKVTMNEVLDRVGRGESIALTRGGQRLAKILPEPGPPMNGERQNASEAFEGLAAFRQRMITEGKAMTIEEIIAAKNEGKR